jgi:hypothetical protein
MKAARLSAPGGPLKIAIVMTTTSHEAHAGGGRVVLTP